MTASNIFRVARRLLQDAVMPYRWEDDELKSNLTFAVRELHKIRPETRYVNGRLVDEVVIPDSNTDEFAIDSRYEEVLAYYVVYLCYLKDSTDTVNQQLAESFLVKFNSKAQI